MAEVNPPLFIETNNSYNAWDLGLPYTDLLGEGVVGASDLQVTQRGAGANASVDVAAGSCWVKGDDGTNQPTYRCYSNGTKNIALAQDATNPRIALIIARVYDAHFAGASYTWDLEAVLGTPAPSPAAPALPNTALLLATVTVPAVGSNVTNAQIVDNRIRSRIGGGSVPGPTRVTISAWSGGPPSSPQDTDIWIATGVDPNNTGVTWQFMYQSSQPTYKWVCIGGTPLEANVETSESTASSSYVNLTTPGPAYTVTRAGDYYMDLQMHVANVSGTTNDAGGQILDNGAGMAEPIFATAAPSANANYLIASGFGRNNVSAGHTLQVLYEVVFGGGTASFAYRRMKIMPIRIA